MNSKMMLAGSAAAALVLTACGGSPAPKPAGPPSAASLAARLGCRI